MNGRIAFLFLALAATTTTLVACGDKDETGGVDENAEPVLSIVSPTEGQAFDEGTEVSLEVAATDAVTGEALGVSEVTWTADGWAGASGSPVLVSDLPVGAYALTASARSAGQDLTATVNITVNAVPVPYTGAMNAMLVLDYMIGVWESSCDGSVSFVLQPSGEMTEGTGSCIVPDYPDDPVPFTLEGTVTDGVLTGALVMTYDGADYRTPFDGALAEDRSISAAYNKTFPGDTGGSLQIKGTWDASPSGK